MTTVTGWLALAGLLCIASPGRVEGDNPGPQTSSCPGGSYRQFDFWVGNWDVVDNDRPDAIVAHAHVTRILSGCVVHELYESTDGHRGESFSLFDASRGVWHQTWVSDRGDLLTIEGQLQGATMHLQGADQLRDGTRRLVRGDWRPEGDGVREIAARSTDGGRSWVPWFDIRFRPHAPEK